jgi:hypothetical protein
VRASKVEVSSSVVTMAYGVVYDLWRGSDDLPRGHSCAHP